MINIGTSLSLPNAASQSSTKAAVSAFATVTASCSCKASFSSSTARDFVSSTCSATCTLGSGAFASLGFMIRIGTSLSLPNAASQSSTKAAVSSATFSGSYGVATSPLGVSPLGVSFSSSDSSSVVVYTLTEARFSASSWTSSPGVLKSPSVV
jgi:hypothetical protein